MMPLSESEQWLLDEICAYASDVTRRYAVAIEGPWGAGKTEISKLRSCAWFEGAAKEDGACLDVRS